jgi:hypothetical protein
MQSPGNYLFARIMITFNRALCHRDFGRKWTSATLADADRNLFAGLDYRVLAV